MPHMVVRTENRDDVARQRPDRLKVRLRRLYLRCLGPVNVAGQHGAAHAEVEVALVHMGDLNP